MTYTFESGLAGQSPKPFLKNTDYGQNAAAWQAPGLTASGILREHFEGQLAPPPLAPPPKGADLEGGRLLALKLSITRYIQCVLCIVSINLLHLSGIPAVLPANAQDRLCLEPGLGPQAAFQEKEIGLLLRGLLYQAYALGLQALSGE